MAIDITNRRSQPRLATKTLKTIVQTISEDLGFSASEVSVVIMDDPGIHELNLTWRAKDKPTDVLSFPQAEGKVVAGDFVPCLGDIVISADTAARQAQSIGHSLEDEYRRLLVHGFLHLLGHDHVNGGHQARNMKLEENLLLEVVDQVMGSAE